jgi:hypothetical protein
MARRRQGPQSTTLPELRRHLEVSQAGLAEVLGTSQPAVLRTENTGDPRLSSILRYVEALGKAAGMSAEVEVVAVIDGTRHRLRFEKRAGQGRRGDPVSDGPQSWRLRAWSDPDLEQALLDRDIVTMTADELGDLTDWPSDDEIRHRINVVFPTTGPQGAGLRLRYLKDFRFNMAVGDVVVVPLAGRRAGIARIDGPYTYVADEPEPRLRHQHAVTWRWVGSRDRLPDDIVSTINAPGTVCSIQAGRAAERLLDFGT